jgi:hypothetical protein
MRIPSILIAGLSAVLALGACASSPKAKATEGALADPQAKPGAVGPGDKKAPILVGPDFITPLKPAQVWGVLSSLDNWGAWNHKVTKVQAGPGLNVGTELRYGWEEREVKAVLAEVKEQERLVWKGARSGSDVLLRWEIKPLGVNTLVSLRAVLKPSAGQTPIANAGLETNAWIGALQIELSRLADEAKKAVK